MVGGTRAVPPRDVVPGEKPSPTSEAVTFVDLHPGEVDQGAVVGDDRDLSPAELGGLRDGLADREQLAIPGVPLSLGRGERPGGAGRRRQRPGKTGTPKRRSRRQSAG